MNYFKFFLIAFLFCNSSINKCQSLDENQTRTFYIRVVAESDWASLAYSNVRDINDKIKVKSDSSGLIKLENIPLDIKTLIVGSLFYLKDTLEIPDNLVKNSTIYVELKRDENAFARLNEMSDTTKFSLKSTFKSVVIDENFNPLVGALIRVDGTYLRSNSNEFGIGTINNIPAGKFMIISQYVGYQSEAITVDFPLVKDSIFRFIMYADLQSIDTITIEIIAGRKVFQNELEIVDLDRHKWVIQYADSTVKLNKLWFVNENTGWGIGESGLILNTSNGGETWEKQIMEYNLYDVFFINSNTGFISSDGFILRTTDLGNKWNKIFISDKKNYQLIKIYFSDESRGYVIARYMGIDFDIFYFSWDIYESIDGGNNWKLTKHTSDIKTLDGFTKKYYKIDTNVIKDRVLYKISNDVLYKSTDNGITWNYLYPPGLRDIFFVSPEIGYAISAKGMFILKTTTGGE